ncbi:hypothetical protein [Flaviaesturariibacter terrae]
MRKLFFPVLFVAAVGCSKKSALNDMNAAQPAETTTSTTVNTTGRVGAYSPVEGSWRRIETRYNQGDGNHYWVQQPADQQFVVTFMEGKLISGGHPYLGQFSQYRESRPGTLTFMNDGGMSVDAPYTLNGNILEITYRQREEVVDRFVKQ